MKLSKKIKCLLFSSIGIVSITVAAIASPVVVLEQNRSNNTVNTSSTQIDSTTSNKLASFSTNWEVKTKAQENVESQFNQFLNYDGNESSNMRDITLLVTNENYIKNKQLMTTISKGLKKLSVSQRNQIKNGMLKMQELTKNNPITEKNIDSIYGHFINQDKINQIKTQVRELQNKTTSDINNKRQNQSISLFDYSQNPTVAEELQNLQSWAFAASGVATLAAAVSVIMWFCDWFGITTGAAIAASCIAAAIGIIAVGLGIKIALVKAEAQGYFNYNLLFIAHSSLMAAPFVSAFADIAFLLMGVSTVAYSFGWVVPTIFGLASLASCIISSLMMFTNN